MLTRRVLLGQASAAVASAALLGRTRGAAATTVRSAVNFAIPRGACDCHVHVFGDAAIFPFAEKRIYTPPQASVEQLLELQRDLHLDRVVVVQPSVYGADNACTIDAVRRMGARARCVAVIDKATPRTALEEMARAGIRGVRLNLETNTAGRFDPADARALLDTTAEQIRGLGWHVQIYTRTSVIADLKNHLAQMPFPVVVDHFGRGNPAQGATHPDFAALLELVKSGHVYVKISGAIACRNRRPTLPRWRRSGRRWSPPIATESSGAPIGHIRTPITGAASRSAKFPRRSRSMTVCCSISCRNGCRTPRCAKRSSSTIRRGSTDSNRLPVSSSLGVLRLPGAAVLRRCRLAARI